MLLCDFGDLASEVRRLEAAGVRALHLDVMDGHFVPNFTYGMPVVEALSRLTSLPLDVHLMIDRPERYLEAFWKAGASCLSIHAEATREPRSVLARIRALGAAAGLALNPATPVSAVADCLEVCDLALPMSVVPGFGGQSFDAVALEKLRQLRQLGPPELLLEVDGGVNAGSIAACAQAGAELFVIGSAIFGTPDYGHSVCQLEQLAETSTRTFTST